MVIRLIEFSAFKVTTHMSGLKSLEIIKSEGF